jgi:acetyl-CoA decarbonylase/synthase complex subunit gamma
MYGKFYLLGAFALVFLISFISRGHVVNNMDESGLGAILNVFIAYSSGIIITPLFLPYLPGRQFSLKGFIAGLIVAFILFHFSRTGNNIYEKIAWFTIIPVISSFMAMNFTGSSTFTSLSGVKKEMKVAVPLQIIFSVVGIILLIISKLLN